MKRKCPQCRKWFRADTGAANRADGRGMNLYCGRLCSGLARRVSRSTDEKKALKSAYDRQRRAELGETLRKAKMDSYYANHDANKAKAAVLRKTPEYKAKHLAYLQTPEYRGKKKDYDEELRKAEYGDFGETWRLLLELEKEIRSRQSSYERRKARGYYTRASINRRRELWQLRKNSTLAT